MDMAVQEKGNIYYSPIHISYIHSICSGPVVNDMGMQTCMGK